MTGLQPEDLLILGVALIIVLNRGFTATGLKLLRSAYVALQLINFSTMILLFQFRLEGYPGKLDRAIRVFLMFFVAWQMVQANQSRAAALRSGIEEEREKERKAQERADRMAQLEEWDREAAAQKDSADQE